eukprot:scaffold834_cov123-Cylindrotheca_fusiformis.AAC.26
MSLGNIEVYVHEEPTVLKCERPTDSVPGMGVPSENYDTDSSNQTRFIVGAIEMKARCHLLLTSRKIGMFGVMTLVPFNGADLHRSSAIQLVPELEVLMRAHNIVVVPAAVFDDKVTSVPFHMNPPQRLWQIK